VTRRRKAERDRRLRRWTLTAVGGIVLSALLLGFAFAGSSNRIAEGVHVAGVDVGGMTPADASALLERRFAAVAGVPVTFMAGEKRWRVTARHLGVNVDWRGAVELARRQSGGFGPFRGFRRLQTRVFGVDVAPPVQVYDAALRFELRRFANEVRGQRREAAIRLRGLVPVVVAGRSGRALDEAAAAGVVVRALAAPSRSGAVELPVRVHPPRVTADDLRAEVAKVRTALSAPVRLALGGTRWRLPRWRIAQLLALPRGGKGHVGIGGPAADRWLAALARNVDAEARDATFAASGDRVTVVPARDGRRLDRQATSANLLRAALSPTNRVARVVVRSRAPERTVAEAEAMGIDRVLATYTTLYAGSSDRIRNLQLAVTAIDGTVVPPGETFSFNDVVGERTEERGYRPAPVIVAGEYEEAVGGGVSQVATTVFNAAWEAGLRIVERNPHALYIDRYELGRDATVNYPNLDLVFVNDTRHWIFVRGAYGTTGIAISIYGGETRRVESFPGEAKVTGPAPLRRELDPTLERGTEVVEEEGTNATAVSVRRVVYDAAGRVLRDEWWRTSYRGEYRIVRVGTKPPPPPPPKPPPKEPEEKQEPKEPPPAATTTAPTTTQSTTTTSTTTTQP
jgi:vancomycin resistance protein YoaR